MGLGTLNNRSTGETIVDAFFNDIHNSLDGDFVGRNTSGVPTSGQNLGTVAIPWGTVRSNAVVIAGQTVDPSTVTVPQNIVISGKKRTTSNQPAFITPNGAALSFQILASITNLVLDINGSSVAVNTDITKSSLTAAPSTQNTALVNDADAADQEDTRLWGEPEHRKYITIDSIGTNITALNGKYAAFSITNGSDTEYFFAKVNTTSNRLEDIKRGYFYDSTLTPKNRIFFSDNDVITLLKVGWIFVEDNATTVDVSYTQPVYSTESPSSPATGDYWYDLANSLWKRYDGASFQIINRTLVGIFASTATACVAARCSDFYAAYKEDNTLDLEIFSTEIVQAKKQFSRVNVAGMPIVYGETRPNWNITTDLAGTTDMYFSTEQATLMYYLYVKDTGQRIISDISPYYCYDKFGMYHPHNPWRCVGLAYNNGSSDITVACDFKPHNNQLWLDGGDTTALASSHQSVRRFRNVRRNTLATFIYDEATKSTLGTILICRHPGKYTYEYREGAGGGDIVGISKNATDTELDGSINSLTGTEKNLGMFSDNISVGNGMSAELDFKIGDRIAAQTESAASTPSTSDISNVQFKVSLSNGPLF